MIMKDLLSFMPFPPSTMFMFVEESNLGGREKIYDIIVLIFLELYGN